MNRKNLCKDCEFFTLPDNRGYGDCRRYAPRPEILDTDMLASVRWPSVYQDEPVCGDFQEWQEPDAMPRNLPKAFLEKFSLWLSEHPDKQARAPENHGCPDCENGILWLERHDKRGKLETARVFCRCYQGSTGNVGRFSLREVQTRGWQSSERRWCEQAGTCGKNPLCGLVHG